jgi:hypothetical protein
MRDAGTAIRKAIYSALNTVIEYNSADVPVVDGKLESTATEYIILGDQTEVNKPNKTSVAHEATIEIVVINKTKGVGGKKVVETIADDILETILPTGNTHGLTIDSPFKITYVRYEDGRAGSVSKAVTELFDNIKTLNFRIRITQ